MHHCMPGACRSHKKVSDPWELELRTVGSHHDVMGIRTRTLHKNIKCFFTCWTTFLDQRFLFNTTKNCGIYILTSILQSFTSYKPYPYFISWVRITKDSVGCGCRVSSLLEGYFPHFPLCLRTCYFSSFPGIWHFMWRLRFRFWLTGIFLWQA